MAVRTSLTHPLQIATIELGGTGRIGVSFCPGKQQASAFSGQWARDLDIDLDAIHNWGATAVVTLVEKHELKALKVERLGEAVVAHGMAWFHLPVTDVTAPGPDFEEAWGADGPLLREMLRSGKSIFVHCKGGLGRAGTIAARLLVELGLANATKAIKMVRSARGQGAIETSAQEAHVHACQPVTDASSVQLPFGDLVTDRAIGALLGLAIGDAVGTTLEFRTRDSYEHITDMAGGGPFKLQPGEWTDDTSMALALADSLISCGRVDPADLMRRFVDWWRNGTYSATGVCFDIGITTRIALCRFEKTGEPIAGVTDPLSAGNGSLMRLAPVAIWGVRAGEPMMREAARMQSATTHGAPACLDACEAYAIMLRAAIMGASFDEAVRAADDVTEAEPIGPILKSSWLDKSREQIKSSGYVAHSLEAALWCVATTKSFREAVLTAANLGDDADTTAAIAGQLAGALYGASGIPSEWRERVAWFPRIFGMAKALLDHS